VQRRQHCWQLVTARHPQPHPSPSPPPKPQTPQLKVSSDKSIYRLAAIDLFRTDAKAFHIARLMTLPPTRDPVMVGDVALPPLLIFNVQLPQYAAGFFGPSDGIGQSIVYYFVLPDDFDPARFENQAALGLLARFVANGRETDGSSTRERLKMIARIANAEEWAVAAPLSATECKLLQNYNEKPVLTRPQVGACRGFGWFGFVLVCLAGFGLVWFGLVGCWLERDDASCSLSSLSSHPPIRPPHPPIRPPTHARAQHFFFVGPNYLEVDMDVHSYAFLARKALNSYHSRLRSVVWENAFVLQVGRSLLLRFGVGGGRILTTRFAARNTARASLQRGLCTLTPTSLRTNHPRPHRTPIN